MIVSPLIHSFLNHWFKLYVPGRVSDLLGVATQVCLFLGAVYHYMATILHPVLAGCKKHNAESTLDVQCAKTQCINRAEEGDP